MSVSDDSMGEEPSGETGAVSVETPGEEAAKSPWDRLQSEYGLFSSPFGRETVMVEGI
jgi:hypothetical protein